MKSFCETIRQGRNSGATYRESTDSEGKSLKIVPTRDFGRPQNKWVSSDPPTPRCSESTFDAHRVRHLNGVRLYN